MTRTFTSEKTTRPLEAAIAWRDDQRAAIKARTATGSCPTVRVAALELIEGLKAGTVLNKSKEPYKPSVIRGYESSLLGHIVPAWGPARLDELTVEDIEAQANRWIAKGLSPSAVRNRLMPLRAVYRRAQRFDQVRSSPLDTAELPAVRDLKQRRYCSREEVAALLDALPQESRALWATAFYTGLRRGELQALELDGVDFDQGIVWVKWSWDRDAGRVLPKSRSGRRRVPIPETLRPILAEHVLQVPWSEGLVFGRRRDRPFVPEMPGRHARSVWQATCGSCGARMVKKDDKTRCKSCGSEDALEPVTLHGCRHTYASLMIAAGMRNMKALSVFMGHATVSQTWDRYGHLLPGTETEAMAVLDSYLSARSLVVV